MKKIRFLIFICMMFSILIIPVVSIGNVNKGIGEGIFIVNDEILNNNISKPKNDIAYKLKNVEKYENQLVYKIKYPIFQNDNLNNVISTQIEQLIHDFKIDFPSNTHLDNESKVLFKLDTDIGKFKDNLIFIKFIIERNYNTYPNPIKFYETLIFDANNNKKVEVSEIFKDGYLNLFFNSSKEYFYNNYGITIDKKSENYIDIKPEKEIYKKIFIKDNKVELFIYDYKKQDDIFIPLSIDKVLPFVKEEYLETTTQTTTSTIIQTTTQSTTKETTTQTTTQSTTKETTTQTTTSTTTQQTSIIDNKTNNTNTKRKIDKNKPMIALTFDDGPNGATTNRILDILEKNNSVATFFVVSRRLDTDAQVLKRMTNLDNQIGNHTANHKDLTKLSSSQIKNELNIVNDKLKEITSKSPTIVRVPYGAVNDNVKKNINTPIIMWSIDTRDWKTKNSKSIQNEVLGKVKDGDIILMHDLYSTTADACEIIIPKLIEQGFQFVTVDELLKYRDVEVKNGVVYRNAYKK